MLKKNQAKAGQNTAEYAILIALVIGAVIAMQTYVQRAFNGRILDTTKLTMNQTADYTGHDLQYEPYYSKQSFDVTRTSGSSVKERGASFNDETITNITRKGWDNATFDNSSSGQGKDY